jgi:hypothetical protein
MLLLASCSRSVDNKSIAAVPSKLRSARVIAGGGGGGETVTSACKGRLGFDVGDSDARFDLAADPNPSCNGGGTALIFGWHGAPGTSFATVQIDGQNFIYGSSGTLFDPPAPLSDGANFSEWRFGPNQSIEAAQTLRIVSGASGTPDTLEITYDFYNGDSAAHLVALRALLDLVSGTNDAPAIVPANGNVLGGETEYGSNFMPSAYYVLPGEPGAPTAVSPLDGINSSVPDKIVFADWSRLFRTDYDFTPDPSVSIGNDVAVAYYWYQRLVDPGTFLTWKIRIGLPAPGAPVPTGPQLAATITFSPNPASIDAQSAIRLVYGPVVATVAVRNAGNATAHRIVYTPQWPPDFQSNGTAEPDPANPPFFDLGPSEERILRFTLTTASQYGRFSHNEAVTFSFSSDSGVSAIASGGFTLPAMGFLPTEAGWGFANIYSDPPPYENMKSYYPDSAGEMEWPIIGGHTFIGTAFYDLIFSNWYRTGWCFGMSASTAVLFATKGAWLNPFNGPFAGMPPALSPGDRFARDVIWRYHSRQLGEWGAVGAIGLLLPDSIAGNRAMFNDVKARIAAGPVMLALTPRVTRLASIDGIKEWWHSSHQVVAYSTRDNPPMVRVYDPNAPDDNTARIELVASDGMQLVNAGGSAPSANDPQNWIMMPMPLSMAQDSGPVNLVLTNRRWIIDYRYAIYAAVRASVPLLGDLLFLLADPAAPRPELDVQQVTGAVAPSSFTPVTPGATATMLAPGGQLAQIEADPAEPLGTTVTVSFAADASSLRIDSPAMPAHYDARLAADFLSDAQGRELHILGASLGMEDAFDMSAAPDRRTFTLSGAPQGIAATLTQAGAQGGVASFKAIVPPSGAVGSLTSYDWSSISTSLVWEKYFLNGATVALVLQDNLVQRRSLVGDQVRRLETLIAGIDKSGIQHSLQVKLGQVHDELARGDAQGGLAASPQGYVTASNVARALRNETDGQKGKAVAPDVAAQIDEAVDILRQMLGQPL